MIGGQVGITHGHREICVSENALQRQNIASIHHEVTGEGVPQHVGHLSVWYPTAYRCDYVHSRQSGSVSLGWFSFLQGVRSSLVAVPFATKFICTLIFPVCARIFP